MDLSPKKRHYLIGRQVKYAAKDNSEDPDLVDAQYLQEVKSSLSKKSFGEGMFSGGRTGEVCTLDTVHEKIARSKDDLAMLLSNQSHPGVETLFSLLEKKKSN